MWNKIEEKPIPKNRYVLVSDGLCVPEIVRWQDKRIHPYNNYNTKFYDIPAGWFKTDKTRLIRIHSNDLKYWMDIPKTPNQED